MKASELRIGNLIQTHRSDPNEMVTITTLSVHPEHDELILVSTCHFPHLTLCQCEPIPLTKEWLLKFGFVHENNWLGFISDRFRIGIRFYNGNPAQCDVTQDGNFIGFGYGHLKHVHQLQNLYFALKGEDLTFSS